MCVIIWTHLIINTMAKKSLFFVLLLVLSFALFSKTTYASIFYSNNFDSNSTGTLPTGWANFASGAFQVGTTHPVSGAQDLEDPTFHAGGFAVYSGTSSSADSAGQLSQVVNLNGLSQGANTGLFLRMSSDGNNGYLFTPDFSASTTDSGHQQLFIFKRVGGSYTLINETSIGLTWSNGDVAILKAEVSGTTLRWKVWKSIGTEPGSWTFSTTDSSVSAAGYVGLYEGSNTSTTAGSISAIDDLYWGTVGSAFTSAPTLTVQSATSLSTNSATLNGTITATGGVTSTIEGFNYGTTTAYGSVASSTGSFAGGSFSQAVSGLSPNTTYHYQAFATNSAGTGTSSDQTFTTSAATVFYSDNFDADTVGALPSGWSNIGSATWQVGTTSPTSGTRDLEDPTFHAGGIAVYTGTSSAANADGQISQVVSLNGSGLGANTGLFLRESSDGRNGYLFAPNFSSGTGNPYSVFIFKEINGAFTLLNTTSIGLSWSNGDIAVLKAEVSGTTLSWKIWKSTSSEPGSWNFSTTDSSVSSAGYIGLYEGQNNSIATGSISTADNIYWGTPGMTFGSAASATSFTVSGPTIGSVNATSTNFTVTPNGTYTGTITPSTSGSGTFAPTSLTFASSSAAQTFTYTPSSTSGSPHTISLSSSPTLTNSSGSIAYTVTSSNVVPVNNAAWLAGLSPYNWYVSGSSYLQAVNPAAYFKIQFTGTSVLIGVDVSALSGAGVAAKQYPRIVYQIDNGAWQTYQLQSTDSQVLLGSSLASGTHSLEVVFLASDVYTARWNGTSSLKITGLVIDTGSTVSSASLLPKRMLSFGDSITEGAWVLGNHTDLTNYSNYEVATSSYAYQVAASLNAEFGNASFGGESWDTVFNSDIPSFINAWNYYFSSNSRLSGGLLSPVPDYVTVNMGANGGPGSPTTVVNWLSALRTATGAPAKIFELIPFNGSGRTNITSGFNTYKSNSSDPNVFLIDLGSNGVTYSTGGSYSYDGLHPNIVGQAQLASLVLAAINADLAVPPTVTAQSATSIATSSVTLNGTITASGSASSTIQGFNYGLTAGYGSVASTTGTFGAGSYSQNLTGLSPSTTYHFQAFATNSGGTGTSSDATFATSALPPPVISSIASSTTQTTATITWTTDQSATSTVNYGLTTSYGTASSSQALVTNHSIALTGLTANTAYHFQVGGANSAGTVSTSTDLLFSTAPIPDIIPPTVSITAPTAGATLKGSITLSATSSDNVGVTGVQFTIDGVNTGSSGTTSPYSISWNSAGATDGSHTIAAVASDAAGNTATSSVSVTVQNAAPVISSIASSTTQTTATITWTTNHTASSTVNYGSTSGYGTASSTAALLTSHSIVLPGLAAGTVYHFQVAGADAVGNISTSTDQTFTTAPLPITPPTVTAQSATSIATSSVTLNGTITGSGNASSTVEGFNYGLTSSYGNVASSTGAFGIGTFAHNLTGLTPSATYHFQAFATNIGGTGTSSDATFVTSALPTPVISSIASVTTQTTATIIWTTDQAASSTVNFGLTSGYGTASTSSSLVTSHSIVLSGLTAGTTYHFQIEGANSAGTLSQSSDQTLTTQNSTPTFSFSGSGDSTVVPQIVPPLLPTVPTIAASIPGAASSHFTRNLRSGVIGNDVRLLQEYLNQHGFAVSLVGPGSLGHETTKFGAATRMALIQFQKAHGIAPASGYFGSLTRAYLTAHP
jgi:lysophospholipase L1-like esterase